MKKLLTVLMLLPSYSFAQLCPPPPFITATGGFLDGIGQINGIDQVGQVNNLEKNHSVVKFDKHLNNSLNKLKVRIDTIEKTDAKMNERYFFRLDNAITQRDKQENTLGTARMSQPGSLSAPIIASTQHGLGERDKRGYQVNQSYQSYHILNAGYKSPSNAGTRMGNVIRFRAHCKLGATQEEVDAGVCPQGSVVNNNSTYQGDMPPNYSYPSDSDFSTIWDAPNGVIDGSNNSTQKSQLFMEHAFHGDTLPPLTPTTRHDLIPAQERMAHRYSILSSRSIAEMPMREIMSDETPGGMSRTWGNEAAQHVIGLTQNSGQPFNSNMSMQGFRRVMARHWFFNPEYQLAVGTQFPSQSLKDLMQMKAWNTYQLYELERETQMRNLLLGQILHVFMEINNES